VASTPRHNNNYAPRSDIHPLVCSQAVNNRVFQSLVPRLSPLGTRLQTSSYSCPGLHHSHRSWFGEL